MSMIVKCVCCDQPVANQYAPTSLCESCKEPCEVCNGPVQNCQHPLATVPYSPMRFRTLDDGREQVAA
jgi:hypothetical protein